MKKYLILLLCCSLFNCRSLKKTQSSTSADSSISRSENLKMQWDREVTTELLANLDFSLSGDLELPAIDQIPSGIDSGIPFLPSYIESLPAIKKLAGRKSAVKIRQTVRERGSKEQKVQEKKEVHLAQNENIKEKGSNGVKWFLPVWIILFVVVVILLALYFRNKK